MGSGEQIIKDASRIKNQFHEIGNDNPTTPRFRSLTVRVYGIKPTLRQRFQTSL